MNNVDKYVKPVAEITSGLNKNPKIEVVDTSKKEATKDTLYQLLLKKLKKD